MRVHDPLYDDLERDLKRRERAMRVYSGRALDLAHDLLLRYRSLELGHPDAEQILDTVDLLNDHVIAETDIAPSRDVELRALLLDPRR